MVFFIEMREKEDEGRQRELSGFIQYKAAPP